jgi:hypothetical protein
MSVKTPFYANGSGDAVYYHTFRRLRCIGGGIDRKKSGWRARGCPVEGRNVNAFRIARYQGWSDLLREAGG